MKNSSETFIQRAREREELKRGLLLLSLSSLALASADTLFSLVEARARVQVAIIKMLKGLTASDKWLAHCPFARPTNKRVWPTELPL